MKISTKLGQLKASDTFILRQALYKQNWKQGFMCKWCSETFQRTPIGCEGSRTGKGRKSNKCVISSKDSRKWLYAPAGALWGVSCTSQWPNQAHSYQGHPLRKKSLRPGHWKKIIPNPPVHTDSKRSLARMQTWSANPWQSCQSSSCKSSKSPQSESKIRGVLP